MSIKMLSDRKNNARQTILDDMESLLYVVLYCALHWLPNNLDREELFQIVSRLFDFSTTYNGVVIGGDGKAANNYSRRYTGDVQFKGQAIKDWLDTVMNYRAPLPDDAQTYKDKWKPEHLDVFWSDFLKTRTLEHDDRVVNKARNPNLPLGSLHSSEDGDGGGSSSSQSDSAPSVHPRDTPSEDEDARIAPVPAEPRPRAAPRGVKRVSQASPARESKRARTSRASTSNSGPPPDPTTPRRSARIREQPPKPPTAVANKPKSAVQKAKAKATPGRRARKPSARAAAPTATAASTSAKPSGRGRPRTTVARK